MASCPAYDPFGVFGATFRELDWKMLIVFERAVLISPNAWYDAFGVFGNALPEKIGVCRSSFRKVVPAHPNTS